ncbi:hypothetical protein SAMN04489761_3749 [Tenacibaculum sp. MAR_2009_124]|nr:hypothetical protein SAMN04489761_3749 [Tenacibaculum sp. MAR_2009_124]
MTNITYIIYLMLSFLMVLYIGNECYQNGKIYINNYFPQNASLANAINNTLLVSYYCLNLGLSVWNLGNINEVFTIENVLLEISLKLSTIILIVGVLHHFNLYAIYRIHKYFKTYKR